MHVLIIEDEREMALAVKKGLEKQGFSIDLAFTGADGLFQFECSDYTAVLLDLNLPDIDGMEVLRTIRAHKSTPLIIIAARTATEEIQTGLDCGADDYVTKPFDLFVLAARIRAVVRRSFGTGRSDIRIGSLVVDPTHRTVRWKDTVIDLSAKEYVLVECLAQHSPNYVTAEELIAYAYDDTVDPFSSVIRVHMANIRKKLSLVTSQVGIVSTKRKGYLLCENPEESL